MDYNHGEEAQPHPLFLKWRGVPPFSSAYDDYFMDHWRIQRRLKSVPSLKSSNVCSVSKWFPGCVVLGYLDNGM